MPFSRDLYIHVIPSASTGGAEKLLLTVLSHIEATHIVYCLSRRGDLLDIYSNKSFLLFRPFQIISLLHFIQKYLFNSKYKRIVLQGWMYHGDLFVSLLAILLTPFKPVITRYYFLNTYSRYHDISFSSRLSRCISIFLSRIVDIDGISISPSSLLSHQELPYRFASVKIALPYVINSCQQSIDDLLNQRRSSRSNPVQLRLIHIARFDPIKNHKLLFSALNIVHNFTIDLYGHGAEATNPDLANLIHTTVHSDHVHRIRPNGILSNIDQRFGFFDFIVLPSLSEGLPLSLIETSMHGLPCIASDVGDVRLASNNCGIYFANNNLQSLVSALRYAANLIKEDTLSASNSSSSRSSRYFDMSLSTYTISKKAWSLSAFQSSFVPLQP